MQQGRRQHLAEADQKRKTDAINRARLFKETFMTHSGEQVLELLKDEFYDVELNPGAGLEFQAGRRDVILQILALVNYEEKINE